MPTPSFHWSATVILSAASLLLTAAPAFSVDGPMGVERIARVIQDHYQSRIVESDNVELWVQIDLKTSHAIEKIKLMPMVDWAPNSEGFPVRFRIEASDDPEFKTVAGIVDHTDADFADPVDQIVTIPAGGVRGRYVRLTATQLRQKRLAFTKIEVWSGNRDVALECEVTDSSNGKLIRSALTRPPRPQGEGVVTDNPQNVIPSNQWHSVPNVAQVPIGGVRMEEGPLKTAMENNVAYLLHSFSNDEMLRQFRERAGLPNPPGLRKPDDFWDVALPGSSAGRFLMGAGNTLRWMEDSDLRERMEALVDGIAACATTNGYIMAYPSNTIFTSERAAYTRSWVTHGLVEAGNAGYPLAFKLLRDYYDWFDRCQYLPELLRRGGQGVQGMIANTRVYFTPVGKPEDIQVIQRYFQENYWLEQLAARDPKAIWLYPYDHPHSYLLTSIEPYLDQYRATGSQKYLDAAMGGWDLYHDKWEHIGGSIAICEGGLFPPNSCYLRRNTGELCGNVFWIFLNQRLQLLFPNEEKYAAEIEKSIYNVALANQGSTNGIRYTAKLLGRKDKITAINTCCEGQGARIYGALPEFIYSTTADGVYINQYAASSYVWQKGKTAMGVQMDTSFPFSPDVNVRVLVRNPARLKVHLRVPSWASTNMDIFINDKKVAVGKPGTFVTLEQRWTGRERIHFTLPMGLRITPYEGMEPYLGVDTYALEYGPILMALTGEVDEKAGATIPLTPEELLKQLYPIPGKPLHFTLESFPQWEYRPYWLVQNEPFTCFPGIGTPAKEAPIGDDDLALASNGTTVKADSEYANEPGCTAQAIDGIIATPTNFTNRWHSAVDKPHPHWIEIKLPEPELIGRVIIRFADPEGYPTSFRGIARIKGKEIVLFDEKKQKRARSFQTEIKPVTTDLFRLEIRESANPNYPNAAQISEIELYPPTKK